jgi:hypothetical protein
MSVLVGAAFAVALVAAVVAAGILFAKYRAVRSKYLPVTSVEEEVARLRGEVARLDTERERLTREDAQRRNDLATQYTLAKGTFERLRAELALVEENLEDISYGLYKPHYTFETSQHYKDELERVYDRKKDMIRAGVAASCSTTWTVGNSKRDGERMTKQLTKVMLRAFNGECDAAVAKVTWNNVSRMEERIRKAFKAINDTGTVVQVRISEQYLELALGELRLTHEYEAKRHEEQEEQRAIRERMRDEERAQREFEKAKQDAASEEARYEKALEKARADVEKAKGAEFDKISAKVRELEAKLAEAHEKMERAKSMAELTKSGHVYVVSNVGSFGDKVFKIGMTRRLEPVERIQELGDASVPFGFDVHALIYCDDAPGLENAFHRHFSDRRVNLVNLRKEYFTIPLADIEAFAQSQGVKVEFTKLAEAREYRETLSLRQQKDAAQPAAPVPAPTSLPDELFPAAAKIAVGA